MKKFLNNLCYLNLNSLDKNLLFSSILNHTHTGLFVLMGPILSQSLFPNISLTHQLMYIYAIIGGSAITRPIGSILFSFLNERFGISTSLKISLIFTICGSIFMACLPFNTNFISFCCLIFVRFFHSTSMSGENVIAKLLLTNNKTEADAYVTGSYLQSTSILGLLIASIGSSAILFLSLGWRFIFIFIASLGILCFYQRIKILNKTEFKVKKMHKNSNFFSKQVTRNYIKTGLKILYTYKKNITTIAFISGVSELTYAIPFIVMNAIIPLITHIPAYEMILWNLELLILDFFLIPLMAKMLKKYNAKNILMLSGIILAAIFYGFSVMIHEDTTFLFVLVFRFIVVVFGVIFLTPQLYFFKNLTPSETIGSKEILINGIGQSIGSGIFGKLTPIICISLFDISHDFKAIGIYASLVCFIAIICILRNSQ